MNGENGHAVRPLLLEEVLSMVGGLPYTVREIRRVTGIGYAGGLQHLTGPTITPESAPPAGYAVYALYLDVLGAPRLYLVVLLEDGSAHFRWGGAYGRDPLERGEAHHAARELLSEGALAGLSAVVTGVEEYRTWPKISYFCAIVHPRAER